MEELQLVHEPFPSATLRRFLSDNVSNINFARTDVATWHPFGFFLKNARGEWRGGLTGYLGGGWMHVNLVWVTEALRGQRHGTRLRYRGREPGCPGAEACAAKAAGYGGGRP